MAGLLERRLIFITGKGGVGKSTVAAALGLAAARNGRRVIIAEVAGQDRATRALTGAPAPAGEHELAEGLWAVSVDPDAALRDYLDDQLKVRAVSGVLTGSRLFQYLTAATPGMRELLTVGKIWDLAQPERRTSGEGVYDLVIVDAPATGHGLAMLAAPRTFAQMAAVGPIARQGATIDATLRDPDQTGVVAVALAEEMPVNEALALAQRVREELGMELAGAVVNAMVPQRFGSSGAERIGEALAAGPEGPAGHALEAALAEHVRAIDQAEQAARLSAAGLAPAELPFIAAEELGPGELEELSLVLEELL